MLGTGFLREPTAPRVVLVAQARMGSERLPDKVLLEIAGRPAIEWLILRARRAKLVSEVRLAIPEGTGDDVLARAAREMGCPCTRGSQEDCLARYLQAARESQADHVVRISGDSPFIDPEMIDAVVHDHLESGTDYTRNYEPIDIPAGLCIETVTREALEGAAREAVDQYDREHVMPYFYRVPGRFSIKRTPVPEKLLRPDLRLTLDTPEDLQALREIADHFAGRDDFSAAEVVDLLDANPHVAAINRNVEQNALAKAAFWIDYGHGIGTGHLSRARTLAGALMARAVRSRFFYREDGTGGEGRADARLTPLSGGSFVDELAGAAKEFGAGAVVFDNYSAKLEEADALSAAGFKIVVIDDLFRPWSAELLVNPNAGASPDDYPYANPDTELLAGAEYALIPEELVTAAGNAEKSGGGQGRALVVFGGSDPAQFTAPVTRGLLDVEKCAALDIVLGPLVKAAAGDEVRKIAAGSEKSIEIHEAPKSLAELFARADVAVSAGGITKYELAIFGVPAVLAAVADNQVASCRGMSEAGACVYAGETFGEAPVTPERLVERAAELLGDERRQAQIARAARTLVDGKGPQRVAAKMADILGV